MGFFALNCGVVAIKIDREVILVIQRPLFVIPDSRFLCFDDALNVFDSRFLSWGTLLPFFGGLGMSMAVLTKKGLVILVTIPLKQPKSR